MSDDQPRQPGFEVVRHYLKDLSFESPRGPLEPEQLDTVDLKRDLSLSISMLPDGSHVVAIYLLVSGSEAGTVRLLCELTYIAEVRLHGIPDPVAPQILSVNVPEVLLRQVNLILGQNSLFGGYPDLVLDSVDFMTLYQSAVARGSIDDRTGQVTRDSVVRPDPPATEGEAREKAHE